MALTVRNESVLFEANENNVQQESHNCQKRIFLKIGKTGNQSEDVGDQKL